MWGDLGISKLVWTIKNSSQFRKAAAIPTRWEICERGTCWKWLWTANLLIMRARFWVKLSLSRYYGHFYYEKNLGPKVAQKSIFRPIFEIKNRFLSKFFSLKIIFLPFILILFFSDQQQWKIGNDLSHWSTANLSTEFREEPQHASILKFEGK